VYDGGYKVLPNSSDKAAANAETGSAQNGTGTLITVSDSSYFLILKILKGFKCFGPSCGSASASLCRQYYDLWIVTNGIAAW
jgi:hypothetical protein